MSWASKTILLGAFFCSPNVVSAEWVKAEGQYAFTENVTKKECFVEAVLEAKRNAMSKGGLEQYEDTIRDFCTDTGKETNCELHQQTLNYFGGGYIAEIRSLDQRREGPVYNEMCIATLEADVKKYDDAPDADLIVKANVTGTRRKFDGELFSIEGEASPGAFIYVFGYYPTTDGDRYFRIAPNNIDNEIKSDGAFQIPASQNRKLYLFVAEFPKEIRKDEVTEYLIVLALKKKLEMFEEQTAEDFHRRLHSIGRHNWQKTEIGYSILKKE